MLTNGVLLAGLFAAGSWNLLRRQTEAAPARAFVAPGSAVLQ